MRGHGGDLALRLRMPTRKRTGSSGGRNLDLAPRSIAAEGAPKGPFCTHFVSAGMRRRPIVDDQPMAASIWLISDGVIDNGPPRKFRLSIFTVAVLVLPTLARNVSSVAPTVEVLRVSSSGIA